jgi:serine/threonine protein kinase
MQAGQNDLSRGNGSVHEDLSILVLKVTSIHSRQQRDIAEKEAKLLSRLSHPSIIRMYDACYRTAHGPMGIAERIVGATKDLGAGAHDFNGVLRRWTCP